MSTLTINDLALEMDASAMRAVSGGMFLGRKWAFYPGSYASTHKIDFDATQSILQGQEILTNNGNNVAFAHDIKSVVKPTQDAQNNINLGGLL